MDVLVLGPMTGLRDRFVARLRDSAPRVDGLLDALDGPSPLPLLDEMEHFAHRLAGTAGSFGFAAVGHQARALEDAIGRLRRGEPCAEDTRRHAIALRAELRMTAPPRAA